MAKRDIIEATIKLQARCCRVEEIVRMLSEDLEYITHEIENDKIVIRVKPRNQGSKCPCCGKISERVHSHYMRKLQDLPIQGKKVKLLIKRRKLFCDNDKFGNRTKKGLGKQC